MKDVRQCTTALSVLFKRCADRVHGTQVDAAGEEKPFAMEAMQQQQQGPDQAQNGQAQMPPLPQNAPLTFTMVLPDSMSAQVRTVLHPRPHLSAVLMWQPSVW